MAPIAFDQPGYSERFELGYATFHPTRYHLALALDRPADEDPSPVTSWNGLEQQLREEIRGAELRVTLTDSHGRVLIAHDGDLNGWTLTNHSYVFGQHGLGGLYRYGYAFDARFLEKYVLEVEVLQASTGAQRYNPVLVLEGVDDGYLWLLGPLLTILWGITVLVVVVVIGLWRWVTRRPDARAHGS